MSGLALAGALSGAGQGLSQGLVNMQQGFIQSGLLKERDEMENKRMQLTFEHQEKLQSEKIASDRAIHSEALQNAKDINQTNVGMHIATTGMTNEANKEIHAETNAANKEIHKDANTLAETLAKMKDKREELNTAATLDISKNSSYVKIIETAEKELSRIRVEQLGLEKAAALAAPGDPIFDHIAELNRQMTDAKKELDLYRGALGKRIGAPEIPTVPKFKLSPELMRPSSGAQPAPTAPAVTGDSSSPVADFSLRRKVTPNTGLVDAVTGTYTPFLSSIADAIRRASDQGKNDASK